MTSQDQLNKVCLSSIPSIKPGSYFMPMRMRMRREFGVNLMHNPPFAVIFASELSGVQLLQTFVANLCSNIRIAFTGSMNRALGSAHWHV